MVGNAYCMSRVDLRFELGCRAWADEVAAGCGREFGTGLDFPRNSWVLPKVDGKFQGKMGG